MIKSRIEKISAALKCDEAAIITSKSGRRYLTGFPSSAGLVFVTAQKGYFLVDFRYIEKAQATVNSCEVILLTNQHKQLNELLKIGNIKKIYVETERLDIASAKEYAEKLEGVSISSEPFLDKLITDMRTIKTQEELDSIIQAQKLTDKTFSHILNFIKPGLTEIEVALEMEFFMRHLGCEGIAFDFVVVSGANSSLPHGVPTDKKLEYGDFLTMDFGALVGGYRSDMTRTIAIGKASDEQKMVYETVLKAQLEGIAAIKEGVCGKDADAAARKIISDAGYGEFFGHSLGHSVGLEIHEKPNCSPSSQDILKAGTIMTVEPGIYLPQKFGVRIEDMVYVTHDGCQNLTQSPKELIIV